MTSTNCPPWDDATFITRLKRILIWSSETVEADAQSLKEGSINADGSFVSNEDERQFEFEMRQVQEINSILSLLDKN